MSIIRPAFGSIDYDAAQYVGVMRVYLLLAITSLLTFGMLHLTHEVNPVVGYLELAGAGAIGLIMVYLKLSSRVAVARTCFLLAMITLLVAMLATGGTNGTGIFWFFMFPVAAFFLAGSREGALWLLLLLGVVGGVWSAAQVTDIEFYYTGFTVRQLLVTLFVVSVGLYVYQRSREQWEARARASQEELKANLRQMTSLHTQVEHTKSEFVTLASHQLRTPISAVKWFSEMLINGDAGRLTSTQLDAVKSIEHGSHRLEAIVDAMLLVSNLELGEVRVQPEPTDLAAVAHRVLKDTARKYSDKHFTVHESYDPGLPKLDLDRDVTKQLLRHLLTNAHKYTPTDGTIMVSIEHSKKKLSPASRGSVLITVTDNGYGIPASQQRDVFAKLFRAENIKSKDTDGTGLGLYIVKAMSKLVGGEAAFESEENKGSAFMVWLPIEGMKKHEGMGNV